MKEDIQDRIILKKILSKKANNLVRLFKKIIVGVVILFSILYIISQTNWGLRMETIQIVKSELNINLEGMDFDYENSLNILGTGRVIVHLTLDTKTAKEIIPNYLDRWVPEEKFEKDERMVISSLFDIPVEDVSGKYDFGLQWILFLQEQKNGFLTLHIAYYKN